MQQNLMNSQGHSAVTSQVHSAVAMAERLQVQPCREHLQRHRAEPKADAQGSGKLRRQMLIGFIFAACLGLIMLILGSVFIKDAVKGDTSITVLLCVLGIVCGLIILCGTAVLGNAFISRKFRIKDGRNLSQHQPQACFHTCSIIYTPSVDQLNGPPFTDPPPAYEMVVLPHPHYSMEDGNVAGSIEVNDSSGWTVRQPILMSPPKYSVAAAPLPAYGDPV